MFSGRRWRNQLVSQGFQVCEHITVPSQVYYVTMWEEPEDLAELNVQITCKKTVVQILDGKRLLNLNNLSFHIKYFTFKRSLNSFIKHKLDYLTNSTKADPGL